MPSHAIRILRLAGAVLVVAAFAGCGTAMAADGSSPLWTATPTATHASGAGGGPAVTKAPPASPSTSASASAKPAHSTVPSTPPSSAPAHSKAGRPRFDGPANSATRTGSAGVALTFDDGPDPVQTPRILDLLAEHHVKATFCLIGLNVVAHPELVRRIVAEGHTLCNHTWRHSLTLGKEKPAVIRADLQRTNDAIRAAAPGAPIKYLRAPGGNFTPDFVKVAADLGMTSIYWQVDPRDWDHPTGESAAAHRTKVMSAIKTHVHKGSIVLSHDFGQPDTIAAYRVLIPWLQHRYQLIALP
jgi:peptidoglycan/xylan/chitin deacetylase (PgdA/CDA1 family)